MTNREKVLKGLECLSDENNICSKDTCPYYMFESCVPEITHDALELLKEQEPVEPIKLENWWKCPSCSGNIVFNMKYCPGCGRKVQWDRWLIVKRY